MSYPYNGRLAPAVGGGLGGLPRRKDVAAAVSSTFGVDWVQCTSAGARNWTSSCAAKKSGFLAACVSTGYIYTSTDYGDTWTERTTSGSRTWAALACSESGAIVYATGGSLRVYKSSDYGETWAQLGSAPSSSAANSIACSDDGQIIAYPASATQVAVSVDGGSTWNTYTAGANANVKSVCMSRDGANIYCLDGSSSGGVYVSSNYGVSWSTVTPPSVNSGLDMACSGDGQTLLVSYSTTTNTYLSKNGGANWERLIPQSTPAYIACSDSGFVTLFAFAGTNGGVITTSTDNRVLTSACNNSQVLPQTGYRKPSCNDWLFLVPISGGYLYTSRSA